MVKLVTIETLMTYGKMIMYQNRVTIICRNEIISCPLQEILLGNGLEVKTFKSIEDMFVEFIKKPHALTIIDAGSYSEDTLKIVSYLQGAKSAPILVLLSKTEPIDRMELFRKGATVCMTTDASPEEQAAQAMALIQIYVAREDNKHRKTLVFGTSLVINPVYHMVVLNGKMLKLTRREFDLLYFMARQDMRVFTPEQLYRNVWGSEDDDQIGDTVKSGIKALRKKLGPYGRNYIQNEWGIGYRFAGKSVKP